MKNNLSVKGPFSQLAVSLEKIKYTTPARSNNRPATSTPLVAALTSVSGILLFSNSLVYTLEPSIWHGGFDSTITWQNASVSWNGFTFFVGSLPLILSGLTLFQVAYNYKEQLNRVTNELRPRFISNEQSTTGNIKKIK